MDTLITLEELEPHLGDDTFCLFDCRFSLADPAAGRRAYAAAHIPDAIRADVDEHLSAAHIAGVTGRHPLPPKDEWIEQVSIWGVRPDMQVVAYDAAGGAFAARLWWMLRWIGHERVAVLDGGWQAWIEKGLPVTAEVPAPRPRSDADYARRPPLARLIAAGDVDGRRQRLLDARDPPRFRGDTEPLDPVAGHIPGARCSPSSANLDAAGRFRSPAELQEKFAASIDGGGDRHEGGGSGKDIVCYCGSGITAAHNILALRHAGFDEPLLYAGSWSEWITDPARGIETGE